MAVYAVKNKKTGEVRLIETRTKSGAINHVALGDYEAVSLNTSALVKQIQAGLKVEVLSSESEDAEAPKVTLPSSATPLVGQEATRVAVTSAPIAAAK